MNCFVTRLCCSLVPGYSLTGSLTNANTLRCPVMYLPTIPDRLATPLGTLLARERGRRWGLHAYPAATTNVRARKCTAAPEGPRRSRRTPSARTMRLDRSSTMRRLTSVRGTSSTCFVARSAFHVKSGEYFAPTGHIEQVSLRQQTGRPP